MKRRASNGHRNDCHGWSFGVAAAIIAAAASTGAGAIAAADEPVPADPPVVTEAPAETGEIDGVTVAVGLPPVPSTEVIVAVGEPPVPPTSVPDADLGLTSTVASHSPQRSSGATPQTAGSSLPATGREEAVGTAVAAGAMVSIGAAMRLLVRRP